MENRFESLEELIKDEDKIVTVTSFALLEGISFKESQELLNKYAEINKGAKDLHLTYILNGIRKDNNTLQVIQVNENTLESEKQLLENDASMFIFSIQKANNIDYNVISIAEEKLLKEKSQHLSGSIIGKNCVKRLLRKNVLPSLPSTTIKGKSAIFMKSNSSVKSDASLKGDEKINEESNKSKGNSNRNLVDMFNKASHVKKIDTKPEKTEPKPKNNGSLSNFFAKQSNKDTPSKASDNKNENENKKENVSSASNIKLESDNKTNKSNKKSDLFDSDTDEDLELQENETIATKTKEAKKDITNQSKTAQPKKSNASDLFDSDLSDDILKDLELQEGKASEIKKTNSSKNKRTAQKKKRGQTDVGNDKSVKKRKRIIVEESDSEDIFQSDKSDSEVIPEFDEEPQPSESKPLEPKNKRRKAVKKTYEDAEGFIVTQTEYVYETASEDENDLNNKVVKKEQPMKSKLEKKNNPETEKSPNKAKNGKGAKKAASSGNQPTLMNFFKRK